MSPTSETVRVVAPATLAEGYSFEATVDNMTFVVVVPEGGVKEGQEFEVPYPTIAGDDNEEQAAEDDMLHVGPSLGERAREGRRDGDDYGTPRHHRAPRGQWRTSLCSCCDVVTQATFWMSFLCLPVFVAQILTRMKLSWKGAPADAQEVSMTFNRVVISYICVLYFLFVPLFGLPAIFLFSVYMLAIAAHARYRMRQQFEIPPGRLLGWMGQEAVDDCVCTFFCPCCTTIQMSRHTHDDKEYPGYCCTTSGLELGAPEVV